MATRSRRPRAGHVDVLDYDDVFAKFDATMEWLARVYVHAMNCIHYMHDKYFYERLEMALHDRDILRTMATGIAGLSVGGRQPVGDPLRQGARRSATRRAWRSTTRSTAISRSTAMPISRVDDIAVELVSRFMAKIRKHPTYRGATLTQSVLTITSNVVYGKNTGNTPWPAQGRAVRAGRQSDARP